MQSKYTLTNYFLIGRKLLTERAKSPVGMHVKAVKTLIKDQTKQVSQ